MGKNKFKEIILKASEGLLETVTDQVLYAVFYELESLDNLSTKNILFYAPQKAGRDLEKINYQVIKRAGQNLLTRGLITKDGQKLKITSEGKDRLRTILPSFRTNMARKTGEVFLVAYDVSETTRTGRSLVCRLLKKKKAMRIQQSLYIIVADPQTDLEKLLDQIEVTGQVLLTKLGKESLIGGKPLKEYLWEKYNLVDLEARYKKFLKDFLRFPIKNLTRQMLDFSFNKILIDDPCLPEEFLEKDWTGDRARKLYQDLSRKITA